MRSLVAWLALCSVGLALIPAHRALSEGPSWAAPTAADRKEAARKFAEGTHAFDLGDYTRAGEAFEAAYSLAPHEDPLLNAAHAWHRAGELSRAANLYARYLREAPANATDRPGATAALARLAGKLARIEVHTTPGVEDVRVDDVPVDGQVVYVVPGTHALRARGAQGEPILQRQDVGPGAEVSVLLSPPTVIAPSPMPMPPPVTVREAPATPPPSPRHGWSPVVVFVEAGLTLATASVMIWSGVDTENALHTFQRSPTQAALDAGRGDEVRTNVLVGATVGLLAVTGATAIWLTAFRGRASGAGVSVGFGSAAVHGSF
jgi:hypothetical protein